MDGQNYYISIMVRIAVLHQRMVKIDEKDKRL